MKANGFSYIRKWLWIFLLLVSLTAMAIFLLIYREFNSFTFIMAGSGNVPPVDVSVHWTTFKLRLLLLLSSGVITIAATGFFWLHITWRRLNKPVRTIDRAVSRLAAGKLNVTVAIESADEFGKIGAGLNELAANLQELLLHIWKQSGQCMALLEKEGARVNPASCTPPCHAAAAHQQIYESIENLREMARTYVFYDVRLEGEQTLAINEPGQIQTALDPAGTS